MTGEDAKQPLEELSIATNLDNSKELHALSDVEKLGFELDNILPFGTTGSGVSLINTLLPKKPGLKIPTGTKPLPSSMGP